MEEKTSDSRAIGVPVLGAEHKDLERKKHTERTMLRVRSASVLFGLVQVVTYYRPYPPGIFTMALGLVGLLALGNIAVWLTLRRITTSRQATRLSLASLCLDIAAVVVLVFLYTFDKETAIWALIYFLPLEGAIRFGLPGSMWTMAAATVLYTVREWYGAQAFGNEFLFTSITFRMGIGFMIGAVAGATASNLTRDRRRLESANTRYESIMDAMSQIGEGVILTRAQKVIYANDAICEITGYGPHEWKSLDAIFGEPSSDALSQSGHLETTLTRKDGSSAQVEVISRTFDTGSIAIVRDIAKRKEMEQEIVRASEMLAQAQRITHTGSWEWDMPTNEVNWSDEMIRIYGVEGSSERFDYAFFLQRVHPDDRETVEAAVSAAYSAGDSFAFEHRAVRPDGSIRVLQADGRVFLDEHGAPIRMVGTGQDITERKEVEQKLQQAYAKEREAVRRSVELDSLRSDFLSTVSHELRTPLTSIGGFGATLAARWDEFDEDERKGFVSRMLVGVGKLNRLISKFLDFSQMERGEPRHIQILDYNLADELTKIINDLAPNVESHDLKIDVGEGMIVLADRDALVCIVENLLLNAVKFSPPGTTIRISAAPTSAGEVTVRVEDQGLGITQEEAIKIFERFYRVTRGDTVPSGTGVGLALVRGAVYAQGGRVWAEPRPQGGTIVSFTLARSVLTQGPLLEELP